MYGQYKQASKTAPLNVDDAGIACCVYTQRRRRAILRMDTFSWSSSSCITALLTDIYCRLWLQSLYMNCSCTSLHRHNGFWACGACRHCLMERCSATRTTGISISFIFMCLLNADYEGTLLLHIVICCFLAVIMLCLDEAIGEYVVAWQWKWYYSDEFLFYAIGPLTLLSCNNFWFPCTMYTLRVFLLGHLKK